MNEVIEIQNQTKLAMEKAISHLETELQKVRAGKANPVMLENVMVDYYGSRVPISNTASVNTQDARTLIIQPWKNLCLRPLKKPFKWLIWD